MENYYNIGFFVQTPFHYYLYESVIDALVKRNVKCHLVLNDNLSMSKEWNGMYEGLIRFIEQIERDDIEAFLLSTVRKSGFVYDCFISPYYSSDIKGLGRLNVRMMYSLAKEQWTYSWWNIFYDKIFCYGKYDYNKLNIHNSCQAIGNPKFDRWFQNTLPNNMEIKKMYNLKLDPTKKTILYAPTYGELSSIDDWMEKINSLQDKYNIIIKLHHGTAYLSSEKERRKSIINKFDNVFDDHVNMLHLLKVCDHVISDYSGIIFDALLAKKNIILLNIKYDSPLTDESSAEIKIRDTIKNVKNEHELRLALQNKSVQNKQLIELNKLVKKYFFHMDGEAGERAAFEIMNLLKKPDVMKENTFLLSLRNKLFK